MNFNHSTIRMQSYCKPIDPKTVFNPKRPTFSGPSPIQPNPLDIPRGKKRYAIFG